MNGLAEDIVHKSDEPVEDVFEEPGEEDDLDLGEEETGEEKVVEEETIVLEQEPVELPVSEKQKKSVPDEETEIVEPKQKKVKKGVVGGRKIEGRETDIYEPKKKQEKWAKEELKEESSEEGAAEKEEDIEKGEKAEETGEKESAGAAVGASDKKEYLEKEEGTKEEDIVEEAEWDESVFDENLSTEGIRKKIVEKAKKESVRVSETSVALNFLEDRETNSLLIGRKKSVHSKHKMDGALFLGRVGEEEHKDRDIYLDSLNPHVVFVCGARGSGKSYVLGVIAEELAKKNNNVGAIVVDPIGVFWSMRFPNKEKRELDAMADWNILPEGLNNLKVFVPEGAVQQAPKNTFDATFSMLPSMLTSEDWCLTFGIDRFSPTGLLLEKTLSKVEKGYSSIVQEKKTRKVRARGHRYDLDGIILCLETDSEINSREKGYKQDSIRALVSRFEAAKAWGVFSEKGTPLAELSREGQLTILDTSFLDDNVTALVIGILARRLLAARKIVTRKEASKKFDKDMDALLELEIPPTWLFIDEAHTLIPSGNVTTPASSALIEYVKQGRRPGLSLVFATQQPSAIDIKVLSQLDVIMSHKLIFDDDIKSVYKRTPTIIPMKYRKATFLKTLPVGVALTGDRAEETSRAFVMKIRPRLSQHEGRDAETTEAVQKFSQGEVDKLALGMAKAKLEKEGMLELEKIRALVDTLNTKYKASSDYGSVVGQLEKEGAIIDKENNTIAKKNFLEKPEPVQSVADAVEESAEAIEEAGEEPASEATELVAIPPAVPEPEAKNIFERMRKKKVLGFIGQEERVKQVGLKYRTVWRVSLQEYNKRAEFQYGECFVDSVTGEFLHYKNKQFVESKGLKSVFGLSQEEATVVSEIALERRVGAESEKRFKKVAEKLIQKGVVGVQEKNSVKKYFLKTDFDLPPTPRHELLSSMSRMQFTTVPAAEKEREKYSKEEVIHALQKIWPNVLVKKIEEVNRPLYEAKLEGQGTERTIKIDAVTGKKL